MWTKDNKTWHETDGKPVVQQSMVGVLAACGKFIPGTTCHMTPLDSAPVCCAAASMVPPDERITNPEEPSISGSGKLSGTLTDLTAQGSPPTDGEPTT